MDSVEIARAETPRGEVVLRRRTSPGAADVIELRVNGVVMMDTQETSGEIELATHALAAVGDPRRVVIGSLGLGFTLQRVLADPRVETAAVVEVEDRLIGWMRDGTVPHGPGLLADQRVTIINADIAMAVAEARSTYDLVLLDADHGSSLPVNGTFLQQCADVLSPGGVLAIRSPAADPAMLASMREVFGAADEQSHDVLRQDRAETCFLYLARSRG